MEMAVKELVFSWCD